MPAEDIKALIAAQDAAIAAALRPVMQDILQRIQSADTPELRAAFLSGKLDLSDLNEWYYDPSIGAD